MLSIRKVSINYPGLKDKILWLDKRCYKRDVRYKEKTLGYILDEDSTVYLIINKGKRETVVGYLLVYNYRTLKEYYLCSAAILKSYQGRGLGKKLFKLFMKCGKGYKLTLHAVNPSMVHIAKANGFRVVKTTKNYYGRNDAILMEKRK